MDKFPKVHEFENGIIEDYRYVYKKLYTSIEMIISRQNICFR
jgi:hypothetical protein